MVANEKALLKAMKKAYTGWGYTITVRKGGRWTIHTPFWGVSFDAMADVPNKVLSLIVLHMGCFPNWEEAYQIYKGPDGPVLQKKVFALADDPFVQMEGALVTPDCSAPMIRRTDLTISKLQVWQRPDNLSILLIDPEYEALIEDKHLDISAVGSALYLEGNISSVFVRAETDKRPEVHIAHLEKVRWIAGAPLIE